MDGDEANVSAVISIMLRYNGCVMGEIATENLVIGALAGLGVVVLIVLFVYVVKQIILRKD